MSRDVTPAEAEAEFWKHLKDSNTGMLRLDQPGYHAQPMTAYREEETNTIWFFTRDDTDLARDAALGGQAGMFTYGSKDQHVWACLAGALSVDQDRERIDRYWNPIVAAWYPNGKEDPRLTLLRFDVEEGQIWVSKVGPVRFGLEIVKAKMTGAEPDIGGMAKVEMDQR